VAEVYFRRPDGAIVAIPREQSDAAQTKGYTPLSGNDVENAQYQDRYGRVPTPDAPLTQPELFEGVKRGDVQYDYDPRQAANEKLASSASFGLLGPDRDDPAALYRAKRAEAENPLASGVLEASAMLGGGAAISAITGGGAALAGGGRLAQAAGWGINALGQGAQAELELSRVEGEDFSPTRAAVIGLVGEVAGHGAAWGISKGIGATRNLVARATRGAVTEQVDRAFKGGWVGDMNAAKWRPELEADTAKRAAEAFDVIEENFDRVAARPKTQARIARQVNNAGAALDEAQGAARTEALVALSRVRDSLVSAEQGVAAAPAKSKKILAELGNAISELEGAPERGKLWRQVSDAQSALQGHLRDLEDTISDAPQSAWMSDAGATALRDAEKSLRESLLREETWGKAAVDAQKSYSVPLTEKYLPAKGIVDQRFRFRNGGRATAEQGKVLKNLIRQTEGGIDHYNQNAALTQYLQGVEDIAKAGFADDKKGSQALLDAVRSIRKAREYGTLLADAAERHGGRAAKAELGVDAAAAVGGVAAFGPLGAVAGPALKMARAGEWLGRAAEALGIAGEKPVAEFEAFFKKGAPHWEAPSAGDAFKENVLRDVLDSPVGKAADDLTPITPDRTVDVGESISKQEFDTLVNQLRVSEAKTEGGEMVADVLQKAEPRLQSEGLIASSAANDVSAGDDLESLLRQSVEQTPKRTPSAPKAEPTAGKARAHIRASEGGSALEQQLGQSVQALDALGPDEVKRLQKTYGNDAADKIRAKLDRSSEAGMVGIGGNPDRERYVQVFENGDRRATNYKTREAAEKSAEQLNQHRGPGFVRIEVEIVPTKRSKSGEAGYVRVDGAERRVDPAQLEELPHRKARVSANSREMAADEARVQSWVKRGGDKMELPEETAEAVMQWTGPGHEILRKPDEVRDWFRKVLPLKVSNPTSDGPLFRGEAMAPEQVAKLLEGGSVDMRNITATSVNEPTGVSFALEGKTMTPGTVPVLFQVDSAKVGFNLVHYNPNEGEVILPPGSYRVTGKSFDPESGVVTVRLSQDTGSGSRGSTVLEGKHGGSRAGGMSPGDAVKAVATSPMGIVTGLGAVGAGIKAADDDTREGMAVGAAGLGAAAALWGNRASLFRLFQTQLVKTTARAMFSGARKAAPGIAARATYTRAALAARQKEITGWQVSPEEVLGRLEEGLSEAPDDAVAPVAIGTFHALQFLAQRVPRAAKLNAVSAREIPIPESSMREYALFERAALRPREALESAQYEGRFAPQTLEAFEELYPDLLLELRVAAVEEVQENGAPPTIQSRLAYAQLFGGDGRIADPAFSPDITAAINAPPEGQAGSQSPSAPTSRPWQALPSRPAGIQKIS
jgi:hypothetical protein